MNCQEAKPGLSPYLDGELPRNDAAGIASHLSGCGECRRLFEELRVISTVIRTQLATRDTPRLDLLAKVMTAIADLPPTRSPRRAPLHRRLMWCRLRRAWPWPGTR
jgi:anti-sigma factor RsiW